MAQRARVSYLILSLIFFLSAIALVTVKFDVLPRQGENLWLVILVLACCVPGLIAWLKGSFDPFEPVYPMALATFIYFGFMVAVLLRTGSFVMLGIDYRDEVTKVIFIALLALVSFYVVYYGHGRQSDCISQRSEMTKADLAYARFWSLVMLGFFGSSFFLWIVVGRVPLWSLWIFGEASYGTWSIEAAGPKLGHLYAAQESLPACALLLIATRSKRHWPLALILLLAAITVLFAGLGIRTRILLAVGSAMAFYYLEKDKRPSVWQIILMGFIVFYVIAGAIGYYRGAGRAPGQDAFGLAEAWDTFAEGSNIATTTLVYVHWVPVFGYDWGRSFLQVLLTPIPSALWPDKYLLFGKPAIGEFIAYGAAAPFLITFYVSFGPAGIVFGMALIGWLCHRMYNAYKANPRDPFAQILVALLWAYLFHVYGRHSVTLIVYGVVYVFAPVWIVRWLVTKRQRGRNTSRLQMV